MSGPRVRVIPAGVHGDQLKKPIRCSRCGETGHNVRRCGKSAASPKTVAAKPEPVKLGVADELARLAAQLRADAAHLERAAELVRLPWILQLGKDRS